MAHHPAADHSMVRADLAEHPALLWVWALWQPRDVLADGVLADIHLWPIHGVVDHGAEVPRQSHSSDA